MKIIFLLPPSEWKKTWGKDQKESVSFVFEKPLEIAVNATEKDLKCKWTRYEEGLKLNKLQGTDNILVLPAISRYSGVMYNAIDYAWMHASGKQYFEDNFLILSGMYGLLRPYDTIWNYKLPIETKWLYAFWGEKTTETLNSIKPEYVVDMLPNSYAKMIQWKKLHTKIVRVNFYNTDGKKISHGVKKIKGEYIKKLCLNAVEKIEDFPGERVQISESEYHINIIQ